MDIAEVRLLSTHIESATVAAVAQPEVACINKVVDHLEVVPSQLTEGGEVPSVVQSDEHQSSMICEPVQQSIDAMSCPNASDILPTSSEVIEEVKANNDSEAISTSPHPSVPMISKAIFKASKSSSGSGISSSSSEQPPQYQSQQQQQSSSSTSAASRLTGAGVFLWEYIRLTDDEYDEKQRNLRHKDVCGEGYTIVLFGQVEEKGKFKGLVLFTDPGGKIDNCESAQTIASRELYEESCGVFHFPEKSFDDQTIINLGSYLLFSVFLKPCSSGSTTHSGSAFDASDFEKNHKILKNHASTPEYWLESCCVTRVFVDELFESSLAPQEGKIFLKDIYGRSIQIGRRCSIALRSFIKQKHVYNFKTRQLLIKNNITLSKRVTTKATSGTFPWTTGLITYTDGS